MNGEQLMLQCSCMVTSSWCSEACGALGVGNLMQLGHDVENAMHSMLNTSCLWTTRCSTPRACGALGAQHLVPVQHWVLEPWCMWSTAWRTPRACGALGVGNLTHVEQHVQAAP